jgi:alpha-galactosidase
MTNTVWLHELDLNKMLQDWDRPQINRAISQKPLSIGGQTFERGVGTHSHSIVYLDLAGGSDRFQASVGLDDNSGGKGSVTFEVVADGRTVFQSGVMTPGQPAMPVDVDVRGVRTLLLLVGDADDGFAFDHANWAEARFIVSGAKPRTIPIPDDQAVILTPKPGPAPRINGPKVYGCRPGNPFIYRIPTTGERPIAFAAEGLPASLNLDPATGIVTGQAPERGEYQLTFHARNSHGHAERSFRIVAGDTLALTPPMGFNNWYFCYDKVTQRLMEEAADVLVSSGMADAGYQYVNIDDCWMKRKGDEPYRDADGAALPNDRFPDMKGLADYIHEKGLKAGLYTSPGPWTCAGFVGAYGHEAAEVRRYMEWGYDFLKYDWCSYGTAGDLAAAQKPYRLMGDLLRQQKRDVVFNICQYGMFDVWKWDVEVGGQSWRTGGDLGTVLHLMF